MAERRFHDHWWTCLPALPNSKEDYAYTRLMRLFADHTLNSTVGTSKRSVYKHGGEDHLVMSFFENFSVDAHYRWVDFIARRLEMKSGPIVAARWSYAFEERVFGEARPRIADLILHWRDSAGDAVVVIEAKRKGGLPKGLGSKDDPDSKYYMHYSAVRDISRKQQMLLVDQSDVKLLPSHLVSDPRLITWQEFSQLQRDIFVYLAGSTNADAVDAKLVAQYREIGLAPGEPSKLVEFSSAQTEEDALIDRWSQACDLYLEYRKTGTFARVPGVWLNEPDRKTLLGRKAQSTRDRELSIWKIPR